MSLPFFKGWKHLINSSVLKDIISILDVAYQGGKVTPEKKDVFKCFMKCPYDKLKVVIIGLDPYPQKGIATGLAFANKPNPTMLSPSLSVIKEALFNPHDLIIWPNSQNTSDLKNNFDISLEYWAEQGVLLLNSSLTTMLNNPESHIDLWRPFISTLLTNLSDRNPGLVYILFGRVAKNLSVYINHNTNCVLTENHPAAFARYGQEMSDDVFIEANKYLKTQYNETIDWCGCRRSN